MVNRIRAAVVSFFFAVCMLLITSFTVSAAEPMEFEYTEYTFDDGNEDGQEWFFANQTIKSVSVSSPSLLKVRTDGGHMIVEPLKTGTATVTAKGGDGSAASIKIKVDSSFFRRQLTDATSFYGEGALSFGTRRVRIFSKPGAKGTLTVGKDRYKVTVNSNGRASLRVKGIYKLNKKIRLTLKWRGQTVTLKDKVFSKTSVNWIKASKRRFSFNCSFLHKGDVIRLVHRGRTYTKKIKKSTDHVTIKMKTKKNVSKKAAYQVTILNRYKQVLYQEKGKLVRWERPYVEEEDYVADGDEE